MITKVLISVSSLIVVKTCEGTPQPITDEPKTKMQFCSDLKSYAETFAIDDFVKSINDRWQLLYPHNSSSGLGNVNSSMLKTAYEGNLNKLFQDCGIQTEIKTTITRTVGDRNIPKEVGVIDFRTLDLSNGNIIMKHRYAKPCCGPLRQLLQIMETDGFQRMYLNEPVIALASSFNSRYDTVIHEWIALLYQKEEITDAKLSAKCLRSKEFADLQFKGKSIREYFENAN